MVFAYPNHGFKMVVKPTETWDDDDDDMGCFCWGPIWKIMETLVVNPL
jgi:hypothetical protein